MYSRGFGLVIVPFWLTAMLWLVIHDIVPSWTAQQPPALVVSDWLRTQGRQQQAAIYDGAGRRLGTIYTTYLIDEIPQQEGWTVRRDDLILIERFGPAAGPTGDTLTPFGVAVGSIFNPEGLLDEFDLQMRCPVGRAVLHGERFHADFSFTLESGTMFRTFKVPLSQAGTISAAFNPLEQLSELRVGQRWRMQIFNPVAALTGVGDRLLPMLVEVTGRDTILTAEGFERECLVVESTNVKAWVDERGIVHKQVVSLPVGGTFQVKREPFDEAAYEQSREQWHRM